MDRHAAIYIAYHRDTPLYSGKAVTPIHVGRALASSTLPAMIGDDTGDNISTRNPCYCELTAHYWAWKNDLKSSFIGLMHYRRLLEVNSASGKKKDRFAPYLSPNSFVANWDRLYEVPEPEWDVILPASRSLKKTLYDAYAEYHNVSDLDRLRDIIVARRPDFLDDFDRTLAGRQLLPGNMFVMRRPMFEHYSELLFDLMEELYDHPPENFEGRSAYDQRYIGFLGERLLTAYLPYALRHFPGLRVEHRTMLLTDKASIQGRSFSKLLWFVLKGRLTAQDMFRLVRERLRRRPERQNAPI